MIKKLIRIIPAVLTAFAMVFTFAACGCSADGDGSETGEPDGTVAAGIPVDDTGEVSKGTGDPTPFILPEDDLSDLNGVEDGTDTASDPSGAGSTPENGGNEPDGTEPAGPTDTGDETAGPDETDSQPPDDQPGDGPSDSGDNSGTDEVPPVTLPGYSGEPIDLPIDTFG